MEQAPIIAPLPVRGMTSWPTLAPSAGFRESNGPGAANQAPLDALLYLVGPRLLSSLPVLGEVCASTCWLH
jgi:hypothetical protein